MLNSASFPLESDSKLGSVSLVLLFVSLEVESILLHLKFSQHQLYLGRESARISTHFRNGLRRVSTRVLADTR